MLRSMISSAFSNVQKSDSSPAETCSSLKDVRLVLVIDVKIKKKHAMHSCKKIYRGIVNIYLVEMSIKIIDSIEKYLTSV